MVWEQSCDDGDCNVWFWDPFRDWEVCAMGLAHLAP